MPVTPPSTEKPPATETERRADAPVSPQRAAILARMAAKKAAAAKPRPPAGRKPQEVDLESRVRPDRHG